MRRRLCLSDINPECLPPAERARQKRAKRSKYHNVRVSVDGLTFPSKREARHYEVLKRQIAAGELAGVIPQVSIPIGAGARMLLDFLPIPAGTKLVFHDPKGYATREWLLKKKLAESLYPIEIVLI